MLRSEDVEDIYLAVDSIDANINCVVYKDLYVDLYQSLEIASGILKMKQKWVGPTPGYWSDATRSYVYTPLSDEQQKQADLNSTITMYVSRIQSVSWQLKPGLKNSKNEDKNRWQRQ